MHYELNDKGKAQIEEGVREYCHASAIGCFDAPDGTAKYIWFSDAEAEADAATGEWPYIKLEVRSSLSRDFRAHEIVVDYDGFDAVTLED